MWFFVAPRLPCGAGLASGGSALISIHHAGLVYVAVLVGCYDGDTCKVTFPNFPPLVATQSLRFNGFDTPELRGGCARSKRLARQARAETENYMRGDVQLHVAEGEEKFGRVLVYAPDLQAQLIKQGPANPSPDKKRQVWCD